MRKVGITPGYLHPDPQREVYGPRTLHYLEKGLAEFLLRHDVLPVLIPECSESQLDSILNEIDGLLLQGGDDIAPKMYGEKPIGPWLGDALRDAFELKVLDAALRLDLPVFGICRGCQLLNVYFGGTLFQDLKTQLPDCARHTDPERYDRNAHAIRFEADNFLSDIYHEQPRPRVNSIHHQGIKRLGKGLVALAHCPDDDLVEAIEWTGRNEGRVMAVQWHPEFGRGDRQVLDPGPLMQAFLTQFS